MKDTRITAYALNELRGDERDKFESDLAGDAGLQGELASASRVADGLAQVMSEPGEGLEPRAREQLLRAIAENQQAFRQRRKMARFAVPVSLAAAASIAVLLWVSGGKTAQAPAVPAADGGGVECVLSGASEGSGEPVKWVSASGEAPEATTAGRTFRLSDRAQVLAATRLENNISMTGVPVRVKPLLWDEQLQRLGSVGSEPP